MSIKLEHGQRVQWTERNGTVTCTGHIVCEDKDTFGRNPLGYYTIAVDKEHYLIACVTAYELTSGWVTRSTAFSNLKPL